MPSTESGPIAKAEERGKGRGGEARPPRLGSRFSEITHETSERAVRDKHANRRRGKGDTLPTLAWRRRWSANGEKRKRKAPEEVENEN